MMCTARGQCARRMCLLISDDEIESFNPHLLGEELSRIKMIFSTCKIIEPPNVNFEARWNILYRKNTHREEA